MDALLNEAPATPGVTADTVAILLSTFNGAAYVREQLSSLLKQTHGAWIVYWRDDGSTDTTVAEVSAVLDRFPPGRVVRLADGRPLGAAASFLTLLRRAVADGMPYVSFADQDDVWLAEKLAWALAMLRAGGGDGPALYFARQTLVDGGLRPFARSPRLRQPLGFPAALTQNLASGCTIVMNRDAAALVAASDPPALCLHDWWSYVVVAAAEGRLLADGRTVVLYRQHAANHVGAPRNLLARGLGAIRRGPGPYMRLLRVNVTALAARPAALSARAHADLLAILAALEGGWRDRLRLLRRMPALRRQGWLENQVFRLWFLLA
jgi:glycosyltransferase involved in cell wall biosynthesis